MYYLRRTFVTPTLLIVSPQEKSETNRVIRHKMLYKEFFFRTTLVSDKKEKNYFFSASMDKMLEYAKDVLKEGIFIGNKHFAL